MRKYKKWAVVLGLSWGLMFTGCNNTNGTMDLISTPELPNGKQEEVKKAIEKLLPSDAELLTAKNSEYKQTIYLDDLNHDGLQEAFIVYKDNNESGQVHFLLLQEENGSWNKVTDTTSDYYTLDYLNIHDLDEDGSKEILIGVGLSDTDQKKQLLVYEFEKEGLTNKVDRSYEKLEISDFDGDNKLDIFILDGEQNQIQEAELLHYEAGQLELQSKVELVADGYHENMVIGKLADGKKAVFLDSGLGAHSMLTEIVAYDNKKLIKIGDENDGILLKAYPLYSKDINKDGVIEVGGMYIPKGYEDAAMAEIPFIYTYSDYTIDGTHETVEQRYVDNDHNFYITIPSEWYNKLTVEKIDQGVRLLDNEDSKILFEVKWTTKDSYQSINTKFGETKDTVFYTDRKDTLLISKDNFHLLEEDFNQ